MFSSASSTARESQTRIASPVLVIVDSGRKVYLPPISILYLGRRDEQKNIHPHIDFTQDDAAKYGVSRRHARIHQSDCCVYVEDLGSTNGTYLNGQRLTPSQTYPVYHGDELQLGKLELQIFLLPGAAS